MCLTIYRSEMTLPICEIVLEKVDVIVTHGSGVGLVRALNQIGRRIRLQIHVMDTGASLRESRLSTYYVMGRAARQGALVTILRSASAPGEISH